MADALQNTDTVQSELPGSSDDLRRLHEEIAELETERDELREALDARDDRIEGLETELAAREDELSTLRTDNEQLREVVRDLEREGADGNGTAESGIDDESPILQAGGDDIEFGYTPVGTGAGFGRRAGRTRL